MVTGQEIELLVDFIMKRACFSSIEATWLNDVLNRLMAQAVALTAAKPANKVATEKQNKVPVPSEQRQN